MKETSTVVHRRWSPYIHIAQEYSGEVHDGRLFIKVEMHVLMVSVLLYFGDKVHGGLYLQGLAWDCVEPADSIVHS